MSIAIESFKTISTQYKAILLDAYGVLKDAEGVYSYVPEMLELLKKEHIEFLILTNDASKSPSELAKSYHENGLHFVTEEKLIASSRVAKNYLLAKYKAGTIISYFGIPEAIEFFNDTNFIFKHISEVDILQNSEIEAFLFLDHGHFSWQTDINKAINLLRLNPKIEGIVANSDLSYPSSETEISIAIGGIARMMENILGCEFTKFGKPNHRMFQLAYDTLKPFHAFAKSEILMVGDTLTTDIAGGNNFGIDTALVLSGATLEKDLEKMMELTGIKPTHVCKNVSLA